MKRPRLRKRDRILWVWLSRIWTGQRSCLLIVKPATVIAHRSPWQSPYVERLIGSIRRECLDRVIVLNEAYLIRIMTSYLEYHHRSRTHLSLRRNAPVPRRTEHPSDGTVIAIPRVGGLHHRYTRAA